VTLGCRRYIREVSRVKTDLGNGSTRQTGETEARKMPDWFLYELNYQSELLTGRFGDKQPQHFGLGSSRLSGAVVGKPEAYLHSCIWSTFPTRTWIGTCRCVTRPAINAVPCDQSAIDYWCISTSSMRESSWNAFYYQQRSA
jgi:hypothetical protein